MIALKLLETECPDIAKKYCDLKWNDQTVHTERKM